MLIYIGGSYSRTSKRRIHLNKDEFEKRQVNTTQEQEIEAARKGSEKIGIKLSSEAFQAYMVEYEQCMENFRHIFATIWQAGALFAAISAGILAFSGSPILGNRLTGISPLIQVLVLIPVIFWYLGIYRPMNRYCELDNDRLVQIENLLNNAIPGLEMSHFQTFSNSRKKEGFVKRMVKFKWLLKPRVVEIVTLFGCSLIVTEIYLLWVNYLSHWL